MANEANVIDLQALNLREDEATTQGTLAVRYLVQKLQEANSNPSLGPTVQALLHSHMGEPSHRPVKEPMVEGSKEEEREKSLSQETAKK